MDRDFDQIIKKLCLLYNLDDDDLKELANRILKQNKQKKDEIISFESAEVKNPSPYDDLSIAEMNYTKEELDEILRINILTFQRYLKGKELAKKTDQLLDAYNEILKTTNIKIKK